MSCPHCHESARFVGYRPKTVQSLVGTFPLERAYYHCRSCGHGDGPLGRGPRARSRQRLTPGAERGGLPRRRRGQLRRGRRGGAREAGRPARLASRPSSGPARRPASDIGRRLAAGETFGAARAWAWHKDAEGKTCAYVSLDLTGLGMQGPGGAAAEGRMAAVGMVYNPVPEDQARWADPPRPGAAVPGAVRGRAGRAGVAGRAAAEAGGPGGHGSGRALDRPERRRGGRGGLLRVNFGAGRGGDPGLLPRRGAPRATWAGRCIPATKRRARSGSSSGATA